MMSSEMLRHPSRQHCNHSGRIASTLRWLYPSSRHPYPLFVLLFFCCRHVVQRKNSPPVTGDLDEFQQELTMAANFLGCQDPVQNHLHPTVAMG